MTTKEKVALVERAEGEVGLRRALELVDLPRSTWFYQRHRVPYDVKHADLIKPLLAATMQSPDYGYRRMAPELSERKGRAVNEKVVRRLNSTLGLTQLRKPRSPKRSKIRETIQSVGRRANLVASLEEIDLYEVLYTDFTEIPYRHGKAVLMPVLDHHSKDVVGWSLGPTRNADLALQAWRRASDRLRRLGVDRSGIIVHSDQDSVYTSDVWVRRLLLHDHVRVSYALRGARDNSLIESWNGRFKGENASLFLEAETIEELERLVAAKIRYYTARRRHSRLENTSPRKYIRWRLDEEE